MTIRMEGYGQLDSDCHELDQIRRNATRLEGFEDIYKTGFF